MEDAADFTQEHAQELQVTGADAPCDSSDAAQLVDSPPSPSLQDCSPAQPCTSDGVSLAPPEGCIHVTADGGVLKHVLVAGSGDHPTLHARCLVHYMGRLAPSGEVFLDTRAEGSAQPVPLVAGRVAAARESGLTLALVTMAAGEKAAVYIQDCKYGYGAAGSFSFPAVPPNAQLVYEVELLSFDPIDDTDGGDEDTEGGPRGLLYEEKLERAERRRMAGNALFLAGKHKEALGTYAMALSYMDEDFMMQLEGAYLDKALAVKAPIHLNMAACQTRLKDYHTAIYNCSEVLKIETGSVKALFRRGRARHLLGQTELAQADLQEALKKSPGDGDILRELAAVKATVRAERQAEAAMFRGAFGPSPPPVVDPLLPREGRAGGTPEDEAAGRSGSGSGAGGLRQRGGGSSTSLGGAGGPAGVAAGAEGRGRRGWWGWLSGQPK